MQKTDLSMLAPGDSCVVQDLVSSVFSSKLVEMGLTKGRKLRVLYQAPFNGPMAVDVEGYILSLRLEEARIVSIQRA